MTHSPYDNGPGWGANPGQPYGGAQPQAGSLAPMPVPVPLENVRYMGMERRLFLAVLHLSPFAAYIIPVAGILAPVLMWAMFKDKDPEIDRHGKEAVNWMISSTIYLMVALTMSLALIGIPIFLALVVCGMVFPILAAAKAHQGEHWDYPITIRFIK